MAYTTSYNQLKADIVRIVEDNSTDLAANLDTIIALAETQCLRDLDLELFQEISAIGVLTIGSATIARPAALIKVDALFIVGQDNSRIFLQPRTLAYCFAFNPIQTVHATPRCWAYQDENTFVVSPNPDFAYPVLAQGIERPTGLSNTNQLTWLSQLAGDLLLYCCLVNAEEYLTNPSQAATWKTEYSQDRLPKAKLELRGMSRATYQTMRQSSIPGAPI